jgi:predicted membrane-bound spermidine synthase
MSATLLVGISRTTEPQTMLRRFLALDAVVTGANGLAYVAASGPLGRLLGVDAALLLELGVFLILFAAGVGYLASRRQPPQLPVKAVIDANLLWAVLSVAALALWFDPTTAGAVWIPMQALTVAGFAALQWSALRVAAMA